MKSCTPSERTQAAQRATCARASVAKANIPVCRSADPASIYAQVIDDATGRTLAHVSSTTGTLEPAFAGKNKTQRAAVVGEEIAKAAKQAGVERVVFDRGFAKFHGRVKALAEAARAAGLKF